MPADLEHAGSRPPILHGVIREGRWPFSATGSGSLRPQVVTASPPKRNFIVTPRFATYKVGRTGYVQALGIAMKLLMFALCAVFAFGGLSAQTLPRQPSPGHTQIPIWPGTMPDARPVTGPDTLKNTGSDSLVGGRPWVYINNVSRPTMTVYSPKGRNTGVAVVVAGHDRNDFGVSSAIRRGGNTLGRRSFIASSSQADAYSSSASSVGSSAASTFESRFMLVA